MHSGFLILVILLLAPLAAAIPLCCLSAVLWKQMPRPAAALEAPAATEPASTPAAAAKAPNPGGQSEYDQLVEAMEKSGWVQAKAARLLNMTPRQIGYALRKHSIPIKKF